jgi:2-C-methyl-D-erythritol 4-phosphate cytidylyltransferase
MSVFALIPAAGCGSRFGSAVKKQYLELNGQPILARTLCLFNESPCVHAVFVIAPAAEMEFCRRAIVNRFGFDKVRAVVCGGEERQVSVYNGLKACDAGPEDIILIHDGVRPFVPAALIAETVRGAERDGACLAAVPARDTLKEIENGRVVATPERKRFWQAQTPQAFRCAILLEAHEKARAEGFCGTDDASLVERLGVPVAVVEGSPFNFKITAPDDLMLAEALGKKIDAG